MNFYSIVTNLFRLTVHSLFLKIAKDGDKTTLLDRLFQASTTLLLRSIYACHCSTKCLASFKLLPRVLLHDNSTGRETSHKPCRILQQKTKS